MRNSLLLLICITTCSLTEIQSAGNLCKIQLYINSEMNERVQFRKPDSNQTASIYADTYYEAVCLTNENVRTRNFISLETSETHTGIMEDKFSLMSSKNQLTNKTKIENGLYYMKAGFKISSASLKTNHTLFCRFLTMNPSVYCEKSLYLIVKPSLSKTYLIVIVILGVVALIALLNVIICSFLRSKSKDNQSSIHKRPSTSSFSRISNASKGRKKSILVNNGQSQLNEQVLVGNEDPEYEYSIYPIEDSEVKLNPLTLSSEQEVIHIETTINSKVERFVE